MSSACRFRGEAARTGSIKASAFRKTLLGLRILAQVLKPRHSLCAGQENIGNAGLQRQFLVASSFGSQRFQVFLGHGDNFMPRFGGTGQCSHYRVKSEDPVRKLAYLLESLLGHYPFAIGGIQAERETGHGYRSRGRRHPIPPQELAYAIPGVAGTGLHRPEIEKRAEIVGESIHRRVSFFRFIAQSFAKNMVDVPGEFRVQAARGCDTHLAGDRPVGENRFGLRLMRRLPRQQFVQNRAERIDVGGRALYFASKLFGAGVIWSQ